MNYVYFVSYSFIGEIKHGFGNTEITMTAPITQMEEIKTIGVKATENLKEQYPEDKTIKAVVTGYQLLRTEQ